MAMNMGLRLLLVTALIVCFVSATEAWKEEPKVMHVGGKVLCQDCSGEWNEWLKGSKPIKGSRVCVTCMDDRRRVIYYGSDETDEQGDFNMIINKYVNGKEVKPNQCLVRLVSSPDRMCNLPTNFAGGRSGVKLSRPPTLVYRDLVKYDLGAFYFTTPMCDEPETNSSLND